MDILKPKKTLMRIYPIFHFVPGDPMTESARRGDGKMHILNTTPDNDIANDMLSSAFKASTDSRPYRIGIAYPCICRYLGTPELCRFQRQLQWKYPEPDSQYWTCGSETSSGLGQPSMGG